MAKPFHQQVVYGQVEKPANGEPYMNLFYTLDDMFEEDCDGQEVLVFKFSHKAVVNRKTTTRITLQKKGR